MPPKYLDFFILMFDVLVLLDEYFFFFFEKMLDAYFVQ